jgi:hypothetical protein
VIISPNTVSCDILSRNNYYTNLKAELDELQNNNNEDLNVELKLEANAPFTDFEAYA